MQAYRVVIDTREQAEYSFDCPTVRHKLDAGDYSVVGLEPVVRVERKSLADFVRTLLHDFQRFAVELEKLAAIKHTCIVVEANLDAVLRGQQARTLRGAKPASLLGASLYVQAKFAIPVHWCGSRQAACAFTDAYLRMVARITARESGVQPAHV